MRVLARLRRHPSLTAGLAIVGALALAAAAAPLLAEADPARQFDASAGKLLPPGTVRYVVEFERGLLPVVAERVERRGGDVVLHRLGRDEVHPAAEIANLGADGLPPRRRFALGTDRFGRDLWSRLLYGGRVSLAVGLLAAGFALVLGLAIGCAAALGGGLADVALMRLVDLALAFPRLFLLIVVIAVFDPGGWALVVALGASAWMIPGRLVRAEILTLKRRDFVTASHAMGQPLPAILIRHLLPNALTPVLVHGGLLVGEVILTESALSFLDLGVPEPTPTWGKMIADVRFSPLDTWWMALVPGLAIAVTVIAFNLIADGLRDALDPRI